MRLRALALTLALGPVLAACLGFGGGGEGEDEPPSPPTPTTSLMTGAAAKNPRNAGPGEARPSTLKDAIAAHEATKTPKGPLDKSPTAFPLPAAADIPRLPGAGPAPGAAPQAASATGLPALPGGGAAIPMAPPPGTQAVSPAAPQRTAAAAPTPAVRKIEPLPAGVNAAAGGASILDVFRKDKVGTLIGRADDLYAERSAQLALEYTQDGGARGWTNPETGTTGTIRPTRTFQQADGGYCREYGIAIQVRQKSNDVKAQADAAGRFACRQPSGRWKFLP